MIDVNTRYILPEDITLASVQKLPHQMLSKLTYSADDYAIGQIYGRQHAKILSKEAGNLLEEFRLGSNLLDAVIGFSQKHNEDPEQVLENAFPLIVQLMEQDFLVPVDSARAKSMEPSHKPGEYIADFEILRCVHFLEDTEVFTATAPTGEKVAIKIARTRNAYIDSLIHNEAEILRHLDGSNIVPRLIAEGFWCEFAYLVMEWIEGESLAQLTAAYLEKVADGQGAWDRYELSCRIAEAYVHLHARGVLHTDVHTRNIIVQATGSVTLIDFGHAGRIGDKVSSNGRVPECSEPEYAAAVLRSRAIPARTPRGEQYSVALMIYGLLTSKDIAEGKHLAFNYEEQDMWYQIANEPALPLITCMNTCPEEIEAVLFRALSKAPRKRFSTMRAFHRQLLHAVNAASQAAAENHQSAQESVLKEHQGYLANPERLSTALEARQLSQDFLRFSEPQGLWYRRVFELGPACSVNFGGAGIAYTLYRMACIQENPRWLQAADLWCERTVAHCSQPNAFHGKAIDISGDQEGRVALYHGPAGVYCVQTLIASARGDKDTISQAVSDFIKAATVPSDNLDLTLGLSSLLIGASLLYRNLSCQNNTSLEALRQRGDSLLHTVWTELDTCGPIADGKRIEYFGVAHGWAGLIYAALRWCNSTGASLPTSVTRRLQELIPYGEEVGSGISWPYMMRIAGRGVSWCNGSSGWVHLWTEAYRHYGDPTYLELAEKTAIYTTYVTDTHHSLCCGSGGQAYAMLNMYRSTGEAVWLKRAREATGRAVKRAGSGYSLYKGMTGIAALVSDMAYPDMACMPLFEQEERLCP